MTISQKDIKLLWGRAGNRCSICRDELSQASETGKSFLLGEQAHIVDISRTGIRGQSILTDKERDTYDNLILLCPTHHTEIDKNPEKYPVDKLHMLKSSHELWVKSQLASTYDSKKEADEVIYANLIDKVVDCCQLYRWDSWSSFANSYHRIIWDTNIASNAFELERIIMRAVFPGTLQRLELSMQTTSIAFNTVANIFYLHCDEKDGNLIEDRFYRIRDFDEKEYHRLLKKYEKWKELYYFMFENLCKALNWFAEEVRKEINPLFFALEGKFITTQNNGLNTEAHLYEYTVEEKRNQPYLIEQLVCEVSEQLKY